MKPLLAAFAAVLLAGCSAAAAPAKVADYMALPVIPPSASIAYGPATSQVVEVFLPKGKGPFPVVVLLHGGCWLRQFEGLKQTSGIAADLAARGVAVWNIDYRGVDEPGGGYPGTYQDVATAVDRLRAEAPRYRLDLNRLVVVGHSAGGHLGLWAAGRPHLPRTSPLWSAQPLPIRTVISLGGVGDLRAQEAQAAKVCGFDRAQLGAPGPAPFADTSPAEWLPDGVRVVMIHGELDPIFPPATGEAYVAKVRAAGGQADFVLIPSVGHFEPVMAATPAWQTVVARIQQELARR